MSEPGSRPASPGRAVGRNPAHALHASVDAFTRALHDYVDTAVGIAGEFPHPGQAETDPRLEAADEQVALAGGRLDDEFRERLGLGAPLAMAWDPSDGAAELEDEVPAWEDFFLHLVVGAAPGTPAQSLDRVLAHVDDAGRSLVELLQQSGFVVPSFDTSRGVDGFDDEEDDGP